jgi:hypothetical protein
MSSKLAQRIPWEVKLQFHPWRILCLAETSSAIVLRRHHGSARKRDEQPPYRDLGEHHCIQGCFRADELGQRTRWDRDFMTRRSGIFPVVTRPQRRQLHLMQSKKRNIITCHYPRAQLKDSKHNNGCRHDRRPRERRPSTTIYESRWIRRLAR